MTKDVSELSIKDEIEISMKGIVKLLINRIITVLKNDLKYNLNAQSIGGCIKVSVSILF